MIFDEGVAMYYFCRRNSFKIKVMRKINFEDVPNGWALCFMNHCVWKDECLRYLAGQTAPDSLTTAVTVVPQACSKTGCSAQHPVKTERLAWGFVHLFDAVSYKDYSVMRKTMENHFGSRHIFYRYHTGAKKLTKKEQAWIADLFVHFGYSETVVFDHYEEVIVFT